jgi:hypothetical protein
MPYYVDKLSPFFQNDMDITGMPKRYKEIAVITNSNILIYWEGEYNELQSIL